MTLTSAIQNLREQISAGFDDLKAAIASKSNLQGDNAKLAAELETANSKLAVAASTIDDLTGKLTAAESERDAQAAIVTDRDATIAKLQEEAASAENRAAGIVANLGVPPVAASGNDAAAASEGTLSEQLAKITDPKERTAFVRKHGRKLFASVQSAARKSLN